MATSSNSLTSLKYHLNTKHADKVQSSPIEITRSFPASKLKQRTLFATKASKKTVEQRYAELVCLDGMSFKAVAESSFIRETMPLLGYKGYTSADTVTAKIISFYKQARATTVTEIEAASSDLWSKRVELLTKTEVRPPCLELLHSALSTVPPTSVEAERIFSFCGQFYTSIRSSLFAKTIDMLVFTKYFLLRHKDNKFLDI